MAGGDGNASAGPDGGNARGDGPGGVQGGTSGTGPGPGTDGHGYGRTPEEQDQNSRRNRGFRGSGENENGTGGRSQKAVDEAIFDIDPIHWGTPTVTPDLDGFLSDLGFNVDPDTVAANDDGFSVSVGEKADLGDGPTGVVPGQEHEFSMADLLDDSFGFRSVPGELDQDDFSIGSRLPDRAEFSFGDLLGDLAELGLGFFGGTIGSAFGKVADAAVTSAVTDRSFMSEMEREFSPPAALDGLFGDGELTGAAPSPAGLGTGGGGFGRDASGSVALGGPVGFSPAAPVGSSGGSSGGSPAASDPLDLFADLTRSQSAALDSAAAETGLDRSTASDKPGPGLAAIMTGAALVLELAL